MANNTPVDFSPIETEILGLRVSRCNADHFDNKELYKIIVQENYDLCRLKVPAEDEMAPFRLEKMGMPHYFSGSIRKYKTRISEPPAGEYNFNDLIFEMYDGSQDELLKQMLIGTWGTYPIGYYRTPYLGQLVDKEKEIECVFRYYKKYNLNKDYPNNSILFIRHGDLYVGFFALNIIDNNLESHIGGILDPYRKSGYFLDKLRYIKEFCLTHHLDHFIFGARNENSEVQRIFQYVGFQAIGSDNVFHIPSLLTYSQIPVLEKEINFQSSDPQEIYAQLFAECVAAAGQIPNGGTRLSFQLNNIEDIKPGKAKFRFSFPIRQNGELLMVIRNIDTSTCATTGYFKAIR